MAENFAETHRNVKFSNNVEATLRQEPGVIYTLAGTSDNYTGNKKARITNRFGRVKMVERTTRNADTNNTDVDSLARFIAPGKLADVAPILDEDDTEVTEVELGSALVNEVASAASTYHDDMASRGFFGNGWTGENGDIAVPFKSSNILVHGGVGITKNKLIALRALIKTRHVNFQREKPIIMVTPDDETALLGIEEYVNTRYGEGTPLADGELKPWMGFRFMPFTPDAESLPTSWQNWFTDGGITRNLPVIVPSGFHRGIWREFKGSIDERADKSHSTQFWGSARSACVRTDEDKAFIIQTR
ncbi:phage capsid protein [Novosphingobium sp.]|uniref:phage capsid protein n=1 Tax=Novosphingobium sp. TaxID=1874826 RepID=UPI0031D1DC3F